MRRLLIGITVLLTGCAATTDDDWTRTPERPWRKIQSQSRAFSVESPRPETGIRVSVQGELLPDGRTALCCTVAR